jgi:CRP-like cAMP-binding protein
MAPPRPVPPAGYAPRATGEGAVAYAPACTPPTTTGRRKSPPVIAAAPPAMAPAAAAPSEDDTDTLTKFRRLSGHHTSGRPLTAATAAALGEPRQGSGAAEAWSRALKGSVLLRKLPTEVQGYVQRSCKVMRVAAEQVVYAQGDMAEAFYVVQSGRFRATAVGADGETQQLVREYGPSEAFGSHELLLKAANLVRRVTVTSLEPGVLWTISKKVFDAKLKMAPVPAPSLVDKVRGVPIFGEMTTEELHLLCRAAKEVSLERGATLVREGSAAREFYALLDGQAKIVRDGDEDNKTLVKAPHVFEQAGFYPNEAHRVHAAEVTAWAGTCMLFRFCIADVEELLGYGMQAKAMAAFHRELLASVTIGGKPLLESLGGDEEEIHWLCSCLVHEPDKLDGEIIVQEGDTDEKLYMIHRGQATVCDAALGEVATLSAGQFFGELALTGRKHKRSATLRAKGGGVAPSAPGGLPPLQMVSLSVSAVRSNPKLEGWMKKLDSIAGATASSAGGKKSRVSGSAGHGGAGKGGAAAADGQEKREEQRSSGGGGISFDTSAASGGGGSKPARDRGDEAETRAMLARRKSFGEMLVEAQKAAQLAAQKAARAASMTKSRTGGGDHSKVSAHAPVRGAEAAREAAYSARISRGGGRAGSARALRAERWGAAPADADTAAVRGPVGSTSNSGKENRPRKGFATKKATKKEMAALPAPGDVDGALKEAPPRARRPSLLRSFSSGSKDLVSALGRRLSGVVMSGETPEGVVWSPTKDLPGEGGTGRWGDGLEKAPLDRMTTGERV